jgi:hypothetical protein
MKAVWSSEYILVDRRAVRLAGRPGDPVPRYCFAPERIHRTNNNDFSWIFSHPFMFYGLHCLQTLVFKPLLPYREPF